MNITNHFNNMYIEFNDIIYLDVIAWYYHNTAHRQETCLQCTVYSFIKNINTSLHISIAYRQKHGLPIYGK